MLQSTDIPQMNAGRATTIADGKVSRKPRAACAVAPDFPVASNGIRSSSFTLGPSPIQEHDQPWLASAGRAAADIADHVFHRLQIDGATNDYIADDERRRTANAEAPSEIAVACEYLLEFGRLRLHLAL